MTACRVKNIFRSKMKNLILVSEKDGIERGFTICGDGALTAGAECTGTACEITIRDCEGKEVAGSFHTHPGGGNFFSLGDYKSSLIRKRRFHCIGFKDGGKAKIRCSDTKHLHKGDPDLHRYKSIDSEFDDLKKHYEENVWGKMPHAIQEIEYEKVMKKAEQMKRISRELERNSCEVVL